MERTLVPLAIPVALLVMTGCAADAQNLSSDEFWAGIHVNGLEVDSPESIEELVDQSRLILTGTIVDVSRGPVEEAGYSDYYSPSAHIGIIAEKDDGSLEAVRVPESSEIFTREAGTQTELETRIEALTN